MPELSSIWSKPLANTAPIRSSTDTRQNSFDLSEDSPRSMTTPFAAFAAAPLNPIGWGRETTPKSTGPTSGDRLKTYRAFNSPETELSAPLTTPQDFLARYQQLKSFQGLSHSLIEDLLYRYDDVCQKLQKAVSERDLEIEYNRTSHRREQRYQENVKRLQDLMDRGPFVLILIDASATIFRRDLIVQGELGGREAARILRAAIQNYIDASLPKYSEGCQIVVRVFGDVSSLGPKARQFSQAFSREATFDYVDIGPVTVDADIELEPCRVKVMEALKLHLHDYHCREIMLCCPNDDAYSALLAEVALDDRNWPRLSLLEGDSPYERHIYDLPFNKMAIDNLFEAIDSPAVDTPQSLSRELSHLNVSDIKEFMPSIAPPALAARPEAITVPSSNASPANLWAAIAAKPAAPIAPPPAVAVTGTTTPKPMKPVVEGIVRNRRGQRIDPVIKHDKTDVERVKKLKMCNNHYLRGPCPSDKCPHVHTYKPSEKEVNTLRLVARMAPCVNGSACDEVKCIYGHVCPAPLQRDGRVTKDGKDCIFMEDCRFPGTLHLRGDDRKEVKLTKVT